MKMFRNLLMLTMSFLLVSIANAQDENKVENSSFETVNGKIKGPGQLDAEDFVPEWEVPRGCPNADIFSNEAKKEEMMIPENQYGASDTQDGNNYVGLLVYSEREAEPRMFITTKLSKTLIAGKKYCVKFHVSLADLSKYAINNLGVHLSASKIKYDDIEAGEVKPQVTKVGNPIISEMGLWTPVCMEYTADGTEKYLTLGNFAKQDEVLTQKMRRPREFTAQQIRGSYYYIDEVSVIASSHLDAPCKCEEEEEDPNDRLQVVYKKNVSENMDMSVEKQISLSKVFFSSGKYALNDDMKSQLASLISLLNDNAEVSIDIEGHCDESETEMYSFDISEKRAAAVKEYLVAEGISGSRLNVVALGSENPDATSGTSQAKAQNRRVEFSAK